MPPSNLGLGYRERQHRTCHQDHFQDLMNLPQQGSLAEFIDVISCKLRLSEDYLVDASLVGLQEEYADPVLLFKPRTMGEARCLARLLQIKLQQHDEKKIAIKNMRYLAPESI